MSSSSEDPTSAIKTAENVEITTAVLVLVYWAVMLYIFYRKDQTDRRQLILMATTLEVLFFDAVHVFPPILVLRSILEI